MLGSPGAPGARRGGSMATALRRIAREEGVAALYKAPPALPTVPPTAPPTVAGWRVGRESRPEPGRAGRATMTSP